MYANERVASREFRKAEEERWILTPSSSNPKSRSVLQPYRESADRWHRHSVGQTDPLRWTQEQCYYERSHDLHLIWLCLCPCASDSGRTWTKSLRSVDAPLDRAGEAMTIGDRTGVAGEDGEQINQRILKRLSRLVRPKREASRQRCISGEEAICKFPTAPPIPPHCTLLPPLLVRSPLNQSFNCDQTLFTDGHILG